MAKNPNKVADSRATAERFDAQYYERFYRRAKTRVHAPRKVHALAAGVTGLLEWWGAPLRTVLDVGAGTGEWGRWLAEHRPAVRYRSTEYSAYACAQYGHEQRDIARWRAAARFDLVVCQGVLPYLADADCASALENLAAMTRGFLYLEAITASDLADVCDVGLTDVAVHRRKGTFYARRLAPHFTKVGAGLYYRKDGPLLFYELERA